LSEKPKKDCPLLIGKTADIRCWGKECAWFGDRGCAIEEIAGILPFIHEAISGVDAALMNIFRKLPP